MDHAPNRIRAVSFDGDGTLWDFDRVMRDALQAVLDKLARVAGPSSVRGLSVDSLKHIRDTLAARESSSALDHHRLRRESFAILLRDLDLYDDALHARLSEAGPRVAAYFSVERLADRVLAHLGLGSPPGTAENRRVEHAESTSGGSPQAAGRRNR